LKEGGLGDELTSSFFLTPLGGPAKGALSGATGNESDGPNVDFTDKGADVEGLRLSLGPATAAIGDIVVIVACIALEIGTDGFSGC
jgi:hypothetical protein